ncbi:PAS domain-containing protein, partial [Desulfosarcina sp. OttesenSCG-928-B08]|nr:PAS domain-containing protein [Desulfosarcina sp. OttesenSCG-928-B08]
MTHDSQAIRAMFEGNPHPSILFDANGRAIDCNPAALAMIEASDKESRLRDINANRYEAVPEFQPDGHRSRPFSENIRQTLEKGHSAFETNLTLSGRQVPFHVICKRAAYGASFAVVACLTDLSRIRAAEAQIRQQSRLLQVINQVAVSLTRAAPRAFDAAVRDAMDMIGRAADVDRL